MNEFIAKMGLKMVNKRKLTHSVVDIVFDEIERKNAQEENSELVRLKQENQRLREILLNIQTATKETVYESTESQATTQNDSSQGIDLSELIDGLFGNTKKD